MISILWEYRAAFGRGMIVTLELSLIVWSVGLVAGVALGVLADRYRRAVGIPTFVAGFLISGIPILVLLYWAHFPLQVLMNNVIDPFITASWVLGLVNTFMVTDAVKTALGAFPEEYSTAAKVCGLDTFTTVSRIKFPIVLRQLLPSLLMTEIAIFQSTLFASLISVPEIFRVAQQVNASIYKPIEIYSALAILFLAICVPVNGLALWLKHRYTRDFSEA